MIKIVGAIAVIERPWTNFVKLLNGVEKKLKLQYEETERLYEVFAVDNGVFYHCFLYKAGMEPLDFDAAKKTQNTTDRTTFETTWKTSGNTQQHNAVVVSNKTTVEVRKPDGLDHDRVYGFSINFCDRTTWYHDAVKRVDTLVASQGQTTFHLSHGTTASNPDSSNEAIIDLSHGKVGDENDITNPDGAFRAMGQGYVVPSQYDPFGIWGPPFNTAIGSLSGYVPLVKVDGVERIERSYGTTTGGDYTIDYNAGLVVFFSALQAGQIVEVTYYWVDSTSRARIVLKPGAGKRFSVDKVEIQTTEDVYLICDIINNVFIDSSVLGLPGGTPMPARRPTVIKNQRDVHNWAHVTHPVAPPQGAGQPRGLAVSVRIHEVNYLSEVPLLSSLGACLVVELAENKPFPGTWASVVIYGISDPETTSN
ncbi:MAG: hypothetical protein AB7L09_00125 [Nitrospira sp.]